MELAELPKELLLMHAYSFTLKCWGLKKKFNIKFIEIRKEKG